MKIFYKTFNYFFALSLILLILGARSYYTHHYSVNLKQKTPKEFKGLPENWFNNSIVSSEESKVLHQFYYSDEKIKNTAIRALENAELFDSMFPGYTFMRFDYLLWRKYFSRVFDSAVWVPQLMEHGSDGIVFNSSSGCIDIFRKYGADIIIFGTSEVYRGIQPKVLSDYLVLSGVKKPKILMCTSGSLLPAHIGEIAELMKESGHRAKLVLFGYSFWSAFLRSNAQEKMNQIKWQNLEKFKKDSQELKMSNFFPELNWDAIVPVHMKKNAIKHDLETFEKFVPPTYAKGKVEELYFPSSFKMKETFLTLNADQQIGSTSYHMLEGIEERDCDLTVSKQILENTLSSLKKISEKIFIFTTITTPLHFKIAPSCFRSEVRKMIHSVSSEHVLTSTDDWKDYGLGYSDFIFSTIDPGFVRLDFNHTNYKGALVVTKKISDKIKGALK